MTEPAQPTMDAPPEDARPVAVAEYVPLELPDGWTEESLDEHGAGRAAAVAAANSLTLVGQVSRVGVQALVTVHDEHGQPDYAVLGDWDDTGELRRAVDPDPRIPAGAVPELRLVHWQGWGVPNRVDAIREVAVDATDAGDGVWRVDDAPPAAILSVRHGLNTSDVRVAAFKGDAPVGVLASAAVSASEVEVVVTPGTTRVDVTAAPEQDDTTTDTTE